MQEPDTGTRIMERNRRDIIKTLNPAGTQSEQLQVDISKVTFCQQPSHINTPSHQSTPMPGCDDKGLVAEMAALCTHKPT